MLVQLLRSLAWADLEATEVRSMVRCWSADQTLTMVSTTRPLSEMMP